MNGCSSTASKGRVPHNLTDRESRVIRALEAVFQLPNANVKRPPKRAQVEEPDEYLLMEPSAKQADPDWKRLQVERIRAWRQKASVEPGNATKGHQAQSQFFWQSKEYQEKAWLQEQPSLDEKAEAKSEEYTHLYRSQQISDVSNQQMNEQPDFTVRGQGQATLGEDGDHTLRANQVPASPGDETPHPMQEAISLAHSFQKPYSRKIVTAEESVDDEEACLAPCSDDENENLAPMVEEHEDEPDKLDSEKKESRAEDPALVQNNEQRNKFGENPLLEPAGRFPRCVQGEDEALISDPKPETVAEQSDKPAADKSRMLFQAAKIKAWRESQSRGFLQAPSDINVASGVVAKKESIPVLSGTRNTALRDVTRERVLETVKDMDEQYGLPPSKDLAKQMAQKPGSTHGLPKFTQPLEALLGVLQSIEHRDYNELASSSEHQEDNVNQKPVGEHTGSLADSKLISDNSWALCQSAKIKAWCEAASKSSSNTLHSNLDVEAVQQRPSSWNTPHTGKWTITPSAPSVEVVHSTNRWPVESTPVQHVYDINSGAGAPRRGELKVAPSNLAEEAIRKTNLWTAESMHVRKGPHFKTSSSWESPLITRDHNLKGGLLEVGSTSVQLMRTNNQHVVDVQAAQHLPNDSSAWWRGVGNRAGHQAGKVQVQHQDLIRGNQDWLLRDRHAAKFQTESKLSFKEAEKKRMQDWAKSVWSQAASTYGTSLKPLSLQYD